MSAYKLLLLYYFICCLYIYIYYRYSCIVSSILSWYLNNNVYYYTVCQLRQDDWDGSHSPNSSHPGGSASICCRPPRDPGGSQPGGDPRPLQVPGQHHARERGAGPGDPEPNQCSQPSVQVPQKVSFTSNHVDSNSKLHFYSCLVLSRLMYGASESWALTGSQAAQLETFHNSCMRRMMGRYRGTGGPSTAELLDVTGQMPISQLQGQVAGACSPQAGDHHRQPTAACRLHPRAPKACRPSPLHVEGWGHARPQRPRAPARAEPPPRLAEAGAQPGAVEGSYQPVLGLSVLIDTSLFSFLVLACTF